MLFHDEAKGQFCLAGKLNGTNGGVAKAMAEVADDAEDLNGAGRGDAQAHGDGAFNMKLDGLRGVLWAGFEENFGGGTSCGSRRGYRLGHGRRSYLAEIDCAGRTSWSVHGAGASGDAEFDSNDGI
jgi:hypothetical protein